MSLVSSNPILADSAVQTAAGQTAGSGTCTVTGVINKTTGLILLAVVSGAVSIPVTKAYPASLMVAFIVSLLVSIASIFLVRSSPRVAAAIAALYSVAQGYVLGALGMILKNVLDQQGIQVPGGIALQAFLIVVSLMIAMLTLFRFGILKGGAMFTSVLSVATLGIFFTFLIAMIMGFFGVDMSWFSLQGAQSGGNAALIGLGINGLVLIIASLWMIVDFRQIQDAVAAGAPASMEWYLAFGLVVTLAWVYLEALKLVFRLAQMFGSRK